LWEASGLPLVELVHDLVQGARESRGIPLSPNQVP
jgi:hypothetical protein